MPENTEINKEEVVVNTEVKSEEVKQEEPQYSEEEVRALESGWIPPEQWKGDLKDHRSAREFNERGELLGKLKSQSTQLREVTEMLKHLGMHNQKIYEASYRDALNTLQAQKVQAIKEGEVDKALALDTKIDEHKVALQQLRQQPAPQQGPSPAFQQWFEKNKWYSQESTLRHWANGMAIEFVKVNPGVSEEELYQFLDREVRKEFPQKFQRKVAPSPDGASRATLTGKPATKSNDEFEKLMADMDEDQARAARNLVRDKVVTKEKYVEDYKKIIGG